MSKLKRRKTSVEERRSEQQFRSPDQNESLRISDASLRSRAEGSPVGEGSSCWTSSALGEMEKIWMKTLRDLCPQSSSQDETLCVPPLPHLSTKVDTHSEQRWCSLDEDVLPLPDLHPHCPPPPSVSTPLPQAPSGCPSHHGTLSARSNWSDGRECEPNVNRVEGECEGEGKGEGEVQSRTSDTSKLNSRAALRSRSDPEAGDGAGAGRGLGSDRARLEHCPMCLMVFPAGFSQLECDGHLAQCLSELNVDIVW